MSLTKSYSCMGKDWLDFFYFRIIGLIKTMLLIWDTFNFFKSNNIITV